MQAADQLKSLQQGKNNAANAVRMSFLVEQCHTEPPLARNNVQISTFVRSGSSKAFAFEEEKTYQSLVKKVLELGHHLAKAFASHFALLHCSSQPMLRSRLSPYQLPGLDVEAAHS